MVILTILVDHYTTSPHSVVYYIIAVRVRCVSKISFSSASGIFFLILFTLLDSEKDIRLLKNEGANVSIMW